MSKRKFKIREYIKDKGKRFYKYQCKCVADDCSLCSGRGYLYWSVNALKQFGKLQHDIQKWD